MTKQKLPYKPQHVMWDVVIAILICIAFWVIVAWGVGKLLGWY